MSASPEHHGSAASGSEPPRRRIPRRLGWALLALLVPLVPIVVAVATGGGSPAAPRAAAATLTPYTAPKPPAPHRPAGRRLPSGVGALVALVTRPTVMRSRPAGPVIARVGLRTPFGSAQTMWVSRRSGGWLGVVSVLAGNGRLGWIPAQAAALSREAWRIDVDLARRQLVASFAGRVIRRWTVAVGAPQSPTPTGRFAVTDRLLTGDSSGPYGCCIVALSAVAPHAIAGWNGGNRIAIHSTPDPSTIGRPDSHGCIRLTLAEGRWLVTHVPLGTPTIVSA